jgi:hypothetical protein
MRGTALARQSALILVMAVAAMTTGGCELLFVPIYAATYLGSRSSGVLQPGEVRYTPAGPQRPTPRPPYHAIDWFETRPDRPHEVIGTLVWLYFRACPPSGLPLSAPLRERVVKKARAAGGDAILYRGKEFDGCDQKGPWGGKASSGGMQSKADVLRYTSQ